ncbi:hypothetical protein [Catenulispora subtropica]|uniref:Uncharacterized protein n=1 Tax=Catenulispora subtropica TaxID=450798 RepID=A0ABN2QLH9_9ACTN
MTETLLPTTTHNAVSITVPDAAMADAIETMIRFASLAPAMPKLGAWSLRRTGTGTWKVRAMSGFHGNEAADIDAIRQWATVLDGGTTQLSDEQGTEEFGYRELTAHGTLGGHTEVVIWDHIACHDTED